MAERMNTPFEAAQGVCATSNNGPEILESAAGTTYNTDFANIVDATTEPTTDLTTGRFYFQPERTGEKIFICVNADAATARMRLYGVNGIRARTTIASGASAPVTLTPIKQWTHDLLGEFTVTGCTKKGVSGGVLDDTWFYTDTIAATGAGDRTPAPGIKIVQGAADNQKAWIEIDARCNMLFLVECTRNGGTATAVTVVRQSMNNG